MKKTTILMVAVLVVFAMAVSPAGAIPPEFYDPFDADLSQWTHISGTWAIVNDGGDNVCSISGGSYVGGVVATVGSETWSDYTLEFDVKKVAGSYFNVVFRYKDSSHHYLLEPSSDAIHIALFKKVGGGYIELTSSRPLQNTTAGTWYHYKIVVQGSSIKVYVGGTLKFDIVDNSLPAGKIGIGAYSDSVAYFDDVSIVSIDTTPPVITIATPADGAVYILNQVVPADWSAADEAGGSGLASATGTVPSGDPIDTATVGEKTFTVTATDNAGNSDTKTITYYVHYGFNGLLSPYQAWPKAFKINSSIPLKWQYTDADGNVVDSSAANPSIDIKPWVLGDVPSYGDPIVVDDPGSSGLRYDTLTMTWQFNWQTKGLTAGIYGIWITSGQTGQTDGPFDIQLRK